MKASETEGLIPGSEKNNEAKIRVSGNRVSFWGISGGVVVEVFALNGSSVQERTGEGENISLDLLPGFYVLRVVSGKQVNVFRVSIR